MESQNLEHSDIERVSAEPDDIVEVAVPTSGAKPESFFGWLADQAKRADDLPDPASAPETAPKATIATSSASTHDPGARVSDTPSLNKLAVNPDDRVSDAPPLHRLATPSASTLLVGSVRMSQVFHAPPASAPTSASDLAPVGVVPGADTAPLMSDPPPRPASKPPPPLPKGALPVQSLASIALTAEPPRVRSGKDRRKRPRRSGFASHAITAAFAFVLGSLSMLVFEQQRVPPRRTETEAPAPTPPPNVTAPAPQPTAPTPMPVAQAEPVAPSPMLTAVVADPDTQAANAAPAPTPATARTATPVAAMHTVQPVATRPIAANANANACADCNGDVDCMIRCRSGAHPATRTASTSAPVAENVPEPEADHVAPPRSEVVSALHAVQDGVVGCITAYDPGAHSPSVAVTVVFASSGRVNVATVAPPYSGTPAGSCIARVVRAATITPFRQPTYRIEYPFAL